MKAFKINTQENEQRNEKEIKFEDEKEETTQADTRDRASYKLSSTRVGERTIGPRFVQVPLFPQEENLEVVPFVPQTLKNHGGSFLNSHLVTYNPRSKDPYNLGNPKSIPMSTEEKDLLVISYYGMDVLSFLQGNSNAPIMFTDTPEPRAAKIVSLNIDLQIPAGQTTIVTYSPFWARGNVKVFKMSPGQSNISYEVLGSLTDYLGGYASFKTVASVFMMKQNSILSAADGYGTTIEAVLAPNTIDPITTKGNILNVNVAQNRKLMMQDGRKGICSFQLGSPLYPRLPTNLYTMSADMFIVPADGLDLNIPMGSIIGCTTGGDVTVHFSDNTGETDQIIFANCPVTSVTNNSAIAQIPRGDVFYSVISAPSIAVNYKIIATVSVEIQPKKSLIYDVPSYSPKVSYSFDRIRYAIEKNYQRICPGNSILPVTPTMKGLLASAATLNTINQRLSDTSTPMEVEEEPIHTEGRGKIFACAMINPGAPKATPILNDHGEAQYPKKTMIHVRYTKPRPNNSTELEFKLMYVDRSDTSFQSLGKLAKASASPAVYYQGAYTVDPTYQPPQKFFNGVTYSVEDMADIFTALTTPEGPVLEYDDDEGKEGDAVIYNMDDSDDEDEGEYIASVKPRHGVLSDFDDLFGLVESTTNKTALLSRTPPHMKITMPEVVAIPHDEPLYYAAAMMKPHKIALKGKKVEEKKKKAKEKLPNHVQEAVKFFSAPVGYTRSAAGAVRIADGTSKTRPYTCYQFFPVLMMSEEDIQKLGEQNKEVDMKELLKNATPQVGIIGVIAGKKYNDQVAELEVTVSENETQTIKIYADLKRIAAPYQNEFATRVRMAASMMISDYYQNFPKEFTIGIFAPAQVIDTSYMYALTIALGWGASGGFYTGSYKYTDEGIVTIEEMPDEALDLKLKLATPRAPLNVLSTKGDGTALASGLFGKNYPKIYDGKAITTNSTQTAVISGTYPLSVRMIDQTPIANLGAASAEYLGEVLSDPLRMYIKASFTNSPADLEKILKKEGTLGPREVLKYSPDNYIAGAKRKKKKYYLVSTLLNTYPNLINDDQRILRYGNEYMMTLNDFMEYVNNPNYKIKTVSEETYNDVTDKVRKKFDEISTEDVYKKATERLETLKIREAMGGQMKPASNQVMFMPESLNNYKNVADYAMSFADAIADLRDRLAGLASGTAYKLTHSDRFGNFLASVGIASKYGEKLPQLPPTVGALEEMAIQIGPNPMAVLAKLGKTPMVGNPAMNVNDLKVLEAYLGSPNSKIVAFLKRGVPVTLEDYQFDYSKRKKTNPYLKTVMNVRKQPIPSGQNPPEPKPYTQPSQFNPPPQSQEQPFTNPQLNYEPYEEEDYGDFIFPDNK